MKSKLVITKLEPESKWLLNYGKLNDETDIEINDKHMKILRDINGGNIND